MIRLFGQISDNVSNYLLTCANKMRKVKNSFLNASMSLSENVMKGCAPVRTGALRDSIRAERSGNEVLIGTSIFYAKFADLGVRPHMIYGQPVLHWDSAFARQVHHPGYPGSLFTEKTEEILTPQIEDLAETFMEQVIS